MVSDDDLVEEFELFGMDLISLDSIETLKELCVNYKLDASLIVAEWVAFAHTNSVNVHPNYETLEVFEREKLSKRDPKSGKSSQKARGSTLVGISSLQDVGDREEIEEMCSAYSTPVSSKTNHNKRPHTPDNMPIKKLTGNDRAATLPFSPSSFSPFVTTLSKKYSSRQNAGEVLLSYGSTDGVSWKRVGENGRPSVAIGAFDNETSLRNRYKYMFQKLMDRAHVLNDMIDKMADDLQIHHRIEEFAHVAIPIQDEVTVVGRVCCDSHGKLNPQSVLLQGSRTTSAGKCVGVNVTQLKGYSLFPGQIVAMGGVNITGHKFVAKTLYEGCAPPKIETRVKTENDLFNLTQPALLYDITLYTDSPVSAVVACGPFTTSDNISYEPLADFIKYLHAHRPDVVIMLGPFVDIKNNEIQNCNVNASFMDHFNIQMDHLSQTATKLGCELILVPSYRDAHHDYVYPQPPYTINNPGPNIHCLPDPAIIHINDTVMALTSTDILFHLGAEEISWSPGSSDRLTRLVTHVINQHSMYPLYPAAADVNIDHDYFEQYTTLPVTPDILITPSDFRYFIKDIKGCCCLNPGRLTKGQVGGTFIRLMISANCPDTGRVSAQVLHI